MNLFLTTAAISGAKLARITLFTVSQAAISTVAAVVIGLWAAFFTARRSFPLRKFLLGLSSIPFCIPSLLIALGYVSFFGRAGYLNTFLMWVTGSEKPPVTFLYSFFGIIICHGFYNFPLVMSTVSDAWERLPRNESDAASMLGAGPFKVFRTITIYQLLPSIISACIPVFIYCFFSFMIVLLFGSIGTTTLEVEIYQLAKVNLKFAAALKLGAFETVLVLLFVIAYTLLEQKSSGLKGISFRGETLEKKKIRGLELIPAVLIFSLIFLFFLCPLGTIVLNGLASQRLRSSCTLYNFIHLAQSKSFSNAIRWTFITASLTGFFCAAIAFIYSVILKMVDPNGRNFLLRAIPILPMAISSIVTGVLITVLVRRGNFMYLVLAQTLLNWPIAFRQIYTDLEKLPQSTVDAARILSRTKLDTILRIFLPSCAPGFLRAFGFCFALSAGDATLPLVLAIPKFDTLALLVYRLAGSYKLNEACAAGVILGILCGGVFYLAKKKRGQN